MRPDKSGVCLHGGLRRQCETCDLADRLEAAEGRIVELRETLQALVVETAAWEFLGIYGVGSTDPVYLAAVDVLRKERKHETTRRA